MDGLEYEDPYEQGEFLRNRFLRFGKLEDIEKAIEYGNRALSLTPDGHPHMPIQFICLGAYYNDHFLRVGHLDDIEKAIDCNTRALGLTLVNDPNFPMVLGNLGASYVVRFQRLGEISDLEKSIEHSSHALALTSDAHPDLPRRYSDLGVSYGDRFQRLGELDDLEKSIEHYSRALTLTPDTHPDLPRRHAALGMSFINRYRRMGEIGDLEKSIEHNSRALALTPGAHPDLADRHADLGVSYEDRYRRTGELGDLEKSIEHKCHALALTPDTHPDLPRRHSALGVSYGDRFQRLGEIGDLEKLTEHFSRALTLTPDAHPDLPRRHATLGSSYTRRYRRMGELGDLEKSIEHNSRALALTPDGHPDLADRHAALGVSYEDRHRHTGEPDDLEKLAEHFSRALALTPDGHPHISSRYFNRAISAHRQYQHTGDPSHSRTSLASFRKASQLSNGAPRDAFDYAFRWAKIASKYSYLDPIDAFRATIDLLPHFIWLGATTTQRYHDLTLAENVAVQAAPAAIFISKYNLALEWLEHGRCVVWNQTLMLRSPVDNLASSHPFLADRIQSVAQELHHMNSHSTSSHSAADDPQHRHRLAREYNDLLAQARKLPGFEDFLQPKKANSLIQAARNGPVVVINCHGARCDALLILRGQDHISHLSLPNFTEQKARHARSEIEATLQRKGLRERGFRLKDAPPRKPDPNIGLVLADLWKDLIQPVLDHLGYLKDDPTDDLPHITWCPTGAVTFLPLHAAGDYDQPRSRVFDHVISSYTPTLAALLSSTPTVLNRAPQVLAIGQAETPGRSPLHGTTRELASLRAHTQDRAVYSQLIGSQATTTAVLDAMEQYDWVHLACHAHQNIVDPTKSGFYLHDGTLDLSAISQRTFRNKGLAFLSACQTATGDEKLPDEAIHLASGMMMAGYPSVIASMWSVMDDDAPLVADKVYAELMQDGKVGNGEAGRALHHAVAELREKVGEKAFGRWVPYIHI
ncbi:unnamed protein product, partial [Rhizoctonia solani]